MADMSMQHWCADVAGVAVAIEAEDRRYAQCVVDRFGPSRTEGRPEVSVRVGATAPVPDLGAASQYLEGYVGHGRDGVVWIGAGKSSARIDGSSVEVGGPLANDDDEDLFDNLLQFALAAALATPGRLLLHGAAIARDDDALLLVGGSGKGKSTLAAAALLDGWELLGDDLALITTAALVVRGVQRPPMFPMEIMAGHGFAGELESSGRGRLRLGLDVLSGAQRRLVGLVTVDHGDEGGVEPLGTGAADVLDDAFAAPPFRGLVLRQLAGGGAVLSLPAVRLRHARDLDRRVARAQELLDEALALCRAQGSSVQ